MKEEGFWWGVEHIETRQLHAAFVTEWDAEKCAAFWNGPNGSTRYRVVSCEPE